MASGGGDIEIDPCHAFDLVKIIDDVPAKVSALSQYGHNLFY
jgi:hypothetical protein